MYNLITKTADIKYIKARPPDIEGVHSQKLFSLFLDQNICCGYSRELSQ